MDINSFTHVHEWGKINLNIYRIKQKSTAQMQAINQNKFADESLCKNRSQKETKWTNLLTHVHEQGKIHLNA